MIQLEERDLQMSGAGFVSGGVYKAVRLEGAGKIQGNVACETMNVNGLATVRGDVSADRFGLSGKMTIHGDLFAQEAMIEGQMTVHGGVRGESIELHGMMKTQGSSEFIHKAALHGGFTILGNLRADLVEVRLSGRCTVKEVRARMIEVKHDGERNWSKSLRWLIPALDPHMKARYLWAEDIRLASTHAELVRGDRIIIGKDCVIERVEYRSSLYIDPEAKVRERVKI